MKRRKNLFLSVMLSFVLFSCGEIPEAVTDLKLGELSASSISVSWEQPSGADTIEIWYGIEGEPKVEFTGTLNPDGTTIDGLESDKIYVIEIFSVNFNGEKSECTTSRASTLAVPSKSVVELTQDEIAALPSVITLDDKDKVAQARTSFDALTDIQKTTINNLAVLKAAEALIIVLEADATDIAIAKLTTDTVTKEFDWNTNGDLEALVTVNFDEQIRNVDEKWLVDAQIDIIADHTTDQKIGIEIYYKEFLLTSSDYGHNFKDGNLSEYLSVMLEEATVIRPPLKNEALVVTWKVILKNVCAGTYSLSKTSLMSQDNFVTEQQFAVAQSAQKTVTADDIDLVIANKTINIITNDFALNTNGDAEATFSVNYPGNINEIDSKWLVDAVIEISADHANDQSVSIEIYYGIPGAFTLVSKDDNNHNFKDGILSTYLSTMMKAGIPTRPSLNKEISASWKIVLKNLTVGSYDFKKDSVMSQDSFETEESFAHDTTSYFLK